MSNHVMEWLSAYLDGELKGGRLHQVEQHLDACEACRGELETMRSLSTLLQQVPAAEFTSNERFVSQVNLRLPVRTAGKTPSRVIEAGWWMIPIGLLAAWIFFSTAVLVSDVVSAADSFGWLDASKTLLVSNEPGSDFWTSALGQVGVLQGEGLQWAETTEELTRNVLPQFVWQASIALLYLAWIAIGWARLTRHARQPQVPLLDG